MCMIIASTAQLDIGYLRRENMKKIAYACRYGHQDITEIVALDGYALRDFNDALTSIVEEENKSGRG